MFCKPTVSLREKRWCVWHGILFEEPSPTGSRPSDLIGLCKQHTKAHPPNTQGRARRKHGGDQGVWPSVLFEEPKIPRGDTNGVEKDDEGGQDERDDGLYGTARYFI